MKRAFSSGQNATVCTIATAGHNRKLIKVRSTRALAVALLTSTGLSSPATAQIAPGLTPPSAVQTVDQNGIDLIHGKLVKVLASISIGRGGAGSLGFDWSTDNSRQWPIWGYVHTTVTPEYQGGPLDTHYSVTVGGSTETFTKLGGSNTITQDQGRPSTFDGTTYTGADGTVAVFGASFTEGLDGNNFAITDAPIQSLTYPTGEFLKYYWTISFNGNFGSANLNAVSSSLGYQLRLTWSGSQVTSAVVFNMNSETCDPSALTCTLVGTWPTLNWDAVNSRVVDNTGRWVGYTTDSSGNQVITYPSGRTITYGPNGYNDGKGIWTYQWPGAPAGAVLIFDPEFGSSGPSRQLTWDITTGQVSTDVRYDRAGGTSLSTSYGHDSFGRPTSITRPDGTQIQYGYDARGNLTSVRQVSRTPGTPADIVASAIYPSSCSSSTTKICNQPTSVTDALLNATDYTYDTSSGQVLTVTKPAASNGIRPQTRFSYSQFSANFRNGSGQTISGTPVSLLTSTSECQTQSSCAGTSDEVKTNFTYDPNQALLPISVSSGSGDGTLTATTTMTYTGNGDVNTVDGPLPGPADTTRNYYDSMRRSLGSIGSAPGNGQPMPAERVTFDGDGRPATTEAGTAAGQGDTDLANMTSLEQQVTTYDAQGRVASLRANAGSTTYTLTQKSYGPAGTPDCVAVRMNPAAFGSPPADACALGIQGTNGPDRITKYTHDRYFRLTSITDGYGTSGSATETTKTYSNLSQLTSVTDANNNNTTYSYDGLGRLSSTCYADSATDCEILTYDQNSNIYARQLRSGDAINYRYDALNRMILKSSPILSDVTYTYDNLGHMLSAANGSGQITNSFDQLGRLTSSSSNLSGSAQTLSYQYDLAGRRSQLTYPDGHYLNYDHLITGEVSAIRLNGATSGAGVIGSYAYDALGNRTSVTYGDGSSTSYAYDPIHRLASIQLNFAASTNNLTKTFSYNPASEITSETRDNSAYAWNGTANLNRSYAANNLNQYTSAGSASYTYDRNGNLTSDGTNSFTFDVENHLTSATVGGVASTLSYDPLGRLWRLQSGSSDTRYVYDGGDMVAVYNGSTLLADWMFGPGADEPISAVVTGTNPTGWLHADERGSIIARTDPTGNVNAIQSYDEYGIPGTSNVTGFQYTGQLYLSQLGMYYYKARMYSTTLGRFMQTDPIGYGDGMNWYAYVHNNPINGTDPLGLCGHPGEGACPAPQPDIVVTGNNPNRICGGNTPCENDTPNSAPIDDGLERGDDGTSALRQLQEAANNVQPNGCQELDSQVAQAKKAYQAANPDFAGFLTNFPEKWDNPQALQSELNWAEGDLSEMRMGAELYDDYSDWSDGVSDAKDAPKIMKGNFGLLLEKIPEKIIDMAAKGVANARIKSLQAETNLIRLRLQQLQAERNGKCTVKTANG